MPRSLRYSVLKFVPDPVRDEAVNLGLVMAASDESWFRADFLRSFGKVRALGGQPAVAYARALVRDLIAQVPMDGAQSRLFPHPDRLDEAILTAGEVPRRGRGRVRATEPLAAVTDSPDELFDDLFRQLVGRAARKAAVPAPQPGAPILAEAPSAAIRNRDDLKKVFRDRALVEWGVPPARLSEEGVEGTVPHRVDFGLYNGKLRFVVHTVSFAGEAVYAGFQRAVLTETALDLRQLRRDVDFTMLFVPAPRGDETLTHLEASTLRFMKSLSIEAVPARDIDQLADLVRSIAH